MPLWAQRKIGRVKSGLRFIVKLLKLCEDMQDLILVLQHRDDSQLKVLGKEETHLTALDFCFK